MGTFTKKNVTSPPGADHFPGPLHHRSTILSALGPNHALTWITHPGSALASFSLNFGVPKEPEANELPKGLAFSSFFSLQTVTTITILMTGKPHDHHHSAAVDHHLCHIPDWPRHSTILSALGLGHALTWVTYPRNALARTHLTSKFRWNLKPVSSQKASCYKEGSIENHHCSTFSSATFGMNLTDLSDGELKTH
ncbi:hypothetical protein DVH24_005663 [Malus domestica]|uniref:Uncharacterized protein n=1 Tax=Malus domestica TaxID=3750 RepID=A0A498IJS1_MALDO|nr:hypothetical protein DVH24_005663 [Malus domestica]